MADSINIGRVFGVEISLHWTFILLMVFTLLVSPYLFLLIVLLFVCVLIHELAHSITSIRNGIKVKRIVLLPIGGASIIDTTNIDPKVEFNIAIVGPLMSIALGFIFGFFVIFAPIGIMRQVLQFLFEINILLGVFNLLPAFPMDGGRVFRSWEQKKHNFLDATMITVKISKYFMVAILVGTFAFVAFASSYSMSYRLFMALWDFIIVAFLYGGANAEAESAVIKESTKGIKVRDVVSKEFLFVKPNLELRKLYNIVRQKKSHIVITKMANYYAVADLFKGIKKNGAAYVRDIAVEIPNVTIDTSAFDAIGMMSNENASIVAVVKGKKLIGIATSSQLQALMSLHMLHKRTLHAKTSDAQE